mmetsp:Transcript_73852/g.213735  ORF Transcript_73852/g.213735 Transcript_73852/m.213735 type:complete len:216 (+) Transcript_73852:225-872(+)
MKSCIKSCVSLISFVKLSSAKLRTLSSWGLIGMTKTANIVLSNCIARKAFAKACCSGDNDSMASLNSCAAGIVDMSNGILSSSLFCTMAAYFGSNSLADAIRPTSTSIEQNWRATAVKQGLAPDSPEKLCDSQAWRYRSPPNAILVDELMGKCIAGACWFLAAKVQAGEGTFESPPAPMTASSRLTVPSGTWRSDLRTAKQNGLGANSSLNTFRL